MGPLTMHGRLNLVFFCQAAGELHCSRAATVSVELFPLLVCLLNYSIHFSVMLHVFAEQVVGRASKALVQGMVSGGF